MAACQTSVNIAYKGLDIPNALASCTNDFNTLVSSINTFSGTGGTGGGTQTTGSTGGGTGNTGDSGNNNGNSASSSSSNNTTMFAGIGGGIVVLIGIGVAVFVVMRRRSSGKKSNDEVTGNVTTSGFADTGTASTVSIDQTKIEQAKLSSLNLTGHQYNYSSPNVYNQYDTKPTPACVTAQPTYNVPEFAPPMVHAPDLPNQDSQNQATAVYPGGPPVQANSVPSQPTHFQQTPVAVPAWNQNLADQKVRGGVANNVSVIVGQHPYASAQYEKMQLKERLERQQHQVNQKGSYCQQQGSSGTMAKPSITWSVQDVSQWLLDSGFDRDVVNSFAEHQINGTILQRLTIDTLKHDLGIDSLRTRTNIMTRIDHLKMSENHNDGFNHGGLPAYGPD
ncbi:polar growth protein [Blyttiomyces sp. JEL0837]|nr:polar growth protein [Blyttiomyces sp. JEL0837]